MLSELSADSGSSLQLSDVGSQRVGSQPVTGSRSGFASKEGVGVENPVLSSRVERTAVAARLGWQLVSSIPGSTWRRLGKSLSAPLVT